MSTNPRDAFARWLESLKDNDPRLYDELRSRLDERLKGKDAAFTAESANAGPDTAGIVLETIVREGRPALLVQDNKITPDPNMAGGAAKVVVERLNESARNLEWALPLVGRVDLANYPGSLLYAGTGWLVAPNIVVTNRHVAQIIAQGGPGEFVFKPGRFGERLEVMVDYRHECDRHASVRVRVIGVKWIETDRAKADIALLEVDRRTDGVNPSFIDLASGDAAPGMFVAVVGYPARAPAYLIPDQAWMDRIYGGTYDIKRIAPGQMQANSRGWATHDCTTLGGNSGSVVLEMATGKAVALHFAGLYMIENYAVPASLIQAYLRDRPWQGAGQGRREEPRPQTSPVESASPPSPPATTAVSGAGWVSVTIPLTITVSLGAPQVGPGTPSEITRTRSAPTTIDEAANQLFRESRTSGVVAVWAGFEIEHGRMTDKPCLVVSALPERMEAVRQAAPSSYAGFPVQVRGATIAERIEAEGVGVPEAPVTSIMYNDGDRTGSGFSFDWVEEEMEVVLHVGPERSWSVLSEFLLSAQRELVSSMYQFHAAHVAAAVENRLKSGTEMTLVVAPQTRDPRSGKIPNGDFDRSETFEHWREKFADIFDPMFVPIGSQGLVANAYHIKVTVRDNSRVWLSSGNWTRTSQPLIAKSDLADPRVTGAAGNREWHAVLESNTLAERFWNHIKADYEQSLKLGGTEEAVQQEMLVDVPLSVIEAVELERAPARVVEPKVVKRSLRVRPLLTPDQRGAVYSKAVLQLIRSAKRQLLFQNQYIKMHGAESGFMSQLVSALTKKAQEIEDCRIILRKPNDELAYDLAQLKKRGIDINRQVRLLMNTHTKGIITDGARVLLGSHNWSSSGVTLNRDASVIFDDEEVAQYYAEAFELDWERASEPRFDDDPAEESVRPAERDGPPPGFARMSYWEYIEG
jgi:V8-like Glu-specific endopeptidase